MNKKRFLLIILLISLFGLVGCMSKKKDPTVIPSETPTPSIVIPSFDDVEMEIGESVVIDTLYDLSINESDIVSLDRHEDGYILTGLKIGEALCTVTVSSDIAVSFKIKVIEKVLFLPVPTGKLLLKGIDKEASVKVIITKPGLSEEDIVWEIDSDCVEMETQGCIAHFKSVARGKCNVTVHLGDYSNTFVLYVTNIRGDIE